MADFVTVVEVDNLSKKNNNEISCENLTTKASTALSTQNSTFVTVLSINNAGSNQQQKQSLDINHDDVNDVEEEEEEDEETETVIVYRLPGERLGFGLKFQGGTKNLEKVQKLFIQSCAKDSPASKVATSWGVLREGDEIINIDNRSVCDMTRIECVKCLKDNVAIKLLVRNGKGQKPAGVEEDFDNGCTNTTAKSYSLGKTNLQMRVAPPPPPPIPPRKLIKKLKGSKDIQAVDLPNNKNAQPDSPEGGVSLCSEKSFTPPPDAEYYVNLFADAINSHQSGHQSVLRNGTNESESDDTASTISTVIDRFSMNSNSSESDLSSFASLTNGPAVVINKSELAKVLKPFTLLENEFQVQPTNHSLEECLKEVITPQTEEILLSSITLIPGNNYENLEFKSEKINTYENIEIKPQEKNDNKSNEKAEFDVKISIPTPTPKPRQMTNHIEPKKRSIIPMPRKFNTTFKMAIEVPPPKIPDDAIINVSTTPLNDSLSLSSREFVTKIPKAINSPKFLERAKTESEIKLRTETKFDKVKLQTSSFIERESISQCKSVTPNKSRIPVILTPKKSWEADLNNERRLCKTSPTNIPRLLTKQKSETDLKLGYYQSKSKESSPVIGSKLPLQRASSAESKCKSPDRTGIPILSQNTNLKTMSSSSSESLNSSASGNKNRGPKPKPPERVQSLQKTQIPKPTVTLNADENVTTVTVVDRTAINGAPANDTPTMQTFKQSPATLNQTQINKKSITSANPNREIRFKIQTYESKTQTDLTAPNVFKSKEEMPSLFELVRRNSPAPQRREDNNNNDNRDVKPDSPECVDEEQANGNDNLECTTPPPLVVGKCKKIEEANTPLYYSSSSSEDEEPIETNDFDEDKDYICEDGEKLGPPELINGPGPSEAYFNLYWHTNMLPTIGEVEEENSSLEHQSLTNGPKVIVDDLSHQKSSKVHDIKMIEDIVTTQAPSSVHTTSKAKKSMGVPVLPPTVPQVELEKLKKSTKDILSDDIKEFKTDSELTTIILDTCSDKITKTKDDNENEQINEMVTTPNTITIIKDVIENIKTTELSSVLGEKLTQEEEKYHGQEVGLPVHKLSDEYFSPSNEVLTELNMDDHQSIMKIEHTTIAASSTKKMIKSIATSSSTHIMENGRSLEKLPVDLKKCTEPVSFTLQPYSERFVCSRNSIMAECVCETDQQQSFTEICVKDATGEGNVEKYREFHEENTKVETLLHQQEVNNEELMKLDEQPIIVTAEAETHLSEKVLNSPDKQNIVGGILNLSGCGHQLQVTEIEDLELVECEQYVEESHKGSQQVPNKTDGRIECGEEPTLVRELSETSIAKSNEKQIIKRSEITKDISKKGPKLVKKTEEEKRLEMEAQKLIESYQKVRKEAEKLFQNEIRTFADEEAGFDLEETGEEDMTQREEDKKKKIIKITDNERSEPINSKMEYNDKDPRNESFTKVLDEEADKKNLDDDQIQTENSMEEEKTASRIISNEESECSYFLHKKVILPPSAEEEMKEDVSKSLPKTANRPLKSRNSVKSVTTESSDEDTAIVAMQTRSKPAIKPKPPVPQKRETHKPVPKRRGSLDTNESAYKCDGNNATPINEIPKPMERIIVGVEHNLLLSSREEKGNKSDLILDSGSLSIADISTSHSSTDVLTQTSSGELLETIHLPDVMNTEENINVGIVSCSSSTDSVKIVGELNDIKRCNTGEKVDHIEDDVSKKKKVELEGTMRDLAAASLASLVLSTVFYSLVVVLDYAHSHHIHKTSNALNSLIYTSFSILKIYS
uniref:PDZ domain-containing protein n=1 Tax=Glossina brevipalpis TaxID=37001 RepID=A0A1A9WE70_9MUSC